MKGLKGKKKVMEKGKGNSGKKGRAWGGGREGKGGMRRGRQGDREGSG